MIPAGAATGLTIGAALGTAAGAVIGSAIGQIVGVIERAFVRGEGSVLDEIARRTGLDRNALGRAIEDIKDAVGRRGKSVTIDPRTGRVTDPKTGEEIGNVIDEVK
jgi:hypothetical protein